MRFIGNKDSITSEIYTLLAEKRLTGRGLVFFDAFCGSGSVSAALSDSFRIVVNDLLTWCVTYTRGRIRARDCEFKRLEGDPFEYLNACDTMRKGFFYNEYSPGGSNRMYFSAQNAGRIDFFRSTIEEWKDKGLLAEDEYAYLLACLIESVSLVANTAGVYGSFLKKWDPRALKPIVFSRLDEKSFQNFELDLRHGNQGDLIVHNARIEDIISQVDCDILYLDPPYTQNQYGTQYHLFETLVLNDAPAISPVTGSRRTAPMRSGWSKDYKVHILFDKVLAETKARYIVCSYSDDGFMSKEFIEASLKRYGKPETYICKKMAYKKYRNFKTKKETDHYEYLFFIEKKRLDEVRYESPLNYMGSKSKFFGKIQENLPEKYDVFFDIFGGGFNVGVNIPANRVVYNDINHFVKQLLESFRNYDTYSYLLYMKRMIKKFGLEKENQESYVAARNYYNAMPPDQRDPRLLFTIMLYGFQQQIRFNTNHDFNNPVGMRWFNDKVLEKKISFSRIIKEHNLVFVSGDFTGLDEQITRNSFVYMDPPYKLTNGSYNDGKRGFEGWTNAQEKRLFEFADRLDARGVKFMLSYIFEHIGKYNVQLKKWVDKRKYHVIYVDPVPGRDRKEVLIVNYAK